MHQLLVDTFSHGTLLVCGVTEKWRDVERIAERYEENDRYHGEGEGGEILR